ncbi:uncharacterized protein LOC119106099 [Pollicipes pollicipes]|uniref:uncharacterized protein LOC119106099 n=1 Tax=Pollicipes pollicipes TaxID=41117 RepID=UPI001885403D|nr:uncharacterized protein LOC119106099 [Pollicipes pollicipes]
MSGSRYSKSSFSYTSSRSTARSSGFVSELSSAVSKAGSKVTSENVHQSGEVMVHEEASEISTSSTTEAQPPGEVQLVHKIGHTLRQMRALQKEQQSVQQVLFTAGSCGASG